MSKRVISTISKTTNQENKTGNNANNNATDKYTKLSAMAHGPNPHTEED